MAVVPSWQWQQHNGHETGNQDACKRHGACALLQ
jgi:hypothetical protein